MLCTHSGACLPRAWASSPAGDRGRRHCATYFFLLHEPHKGCPLDLHGLALSVVEGQDEVEEVGFPQIGRRLLLKVSPGQTHPAVAKDAELDGSVEATRASLVTHNIRVTPQTPTSSAPKTSSGRPSRPLRCSGCSLRQDTYTPAGASRPAEDRARPQKVPKRCESFVWVLCATRRSPKLLLRPEACCTRRNEWRWAR